MCVSLPLDVMSSLVILSVKYDGIWGFSMLYQLFVLVYSVLLETMQNKVHEDLHI